MKFIILFLAGFFALFSISNNEFNTLESVDQSQLYLDIVQEFEIVDEVNLINLIQDNEGVFLYDVKGEKDGNAVSFKVEIDAENAANKTVRPCTCSTDYRARSWAGDRWVCNLWCW